MDDVIALLEDHIDIAAEPARVWELVGDPTRMSRWSPQVTSTRLRSGFDSVGVGTQFTNRNVHGELEWTTHAEVTSYAPGRELGFRVEENWALWSFHLEPTDSGTRLTQRRELPEGISPLSSELTDAAMGGQAAFTASLRAGMRETLEAIRAEAEAPQPS